MWALVVYPPLVIPARIGFPDSCPDCGTDQVAYVHEWVERKLANIDEEHRFGEGWPLVTAYHTVRFRCPQCRTIITPNPPNAVPGFRFQRMIAAHIRTAYCFGRDVDAIPRTLRPEGIKLSRATVYRFLEATEEEELEELRRENRRRARRARRATAALATYDHFFAEIPDRSHSIGRPLIGGPEVDGPADRLLDVYRRVELLRLYHDATSAATLRWLDGYLGGLGSAGVQAYPSLRELLHRFEPFKTRLKQEQQYTRSIAAMSLAQLNGPLDTDRLEVRLPVCAVIRRAVWAEETRKAGEGPLIPERRLYDYF